MTKAITILNKYSLKLNMENSTAIITDIIGINEKVIIPRSINYDHRYIITDINEKALRFNNHIRAIEFSDDAEIKSFKKNIFSNAIISITIPKNVIELEEGWCKSATSLNQVIVSPNNKMIGYLDEDHKLIGRKSNPNNSDYDILEFACRDIIKAHIPSTIKHINAFAFSCCSLLKDITFSEDSELISIGKNALSNCDNLKQLFFPSKLKKLNKKWRNKFTINKLLISSKNENFGYLDDRHKMVGFKSDPTQNFYDTLIFVSPDVESIHVPDSIKYIKSDSFSYCLELKNIHFSINSELISIESNAFVFTIVNRIFIPQKVSILENDWNNQMLDLNKIDVAPNNPNFLIKDGLIYGKTDPKSDIYDTIVFTDRNIEKAVIPSYVKKIYSSAFCQSYLNEVTFSEDSQLESIGNFAFKNTNIEYIFIPKHVKKIGNGAFYQTKNLSQVEFDKNSEISSIGYNVFAKSKIKKIIIPSHVKKLRYYAFINLYQLETIEFQENSELEYFPNYLFSNSSIQSLFIPPGVCNMQNNWCGSVDKLNKVIISPKNKNFVYIDKEEKLIAKKSDRNSDCFDTIIFASRDINYAFIPSYIKYINSYSFSNCTKLETVEFEENSQLVLIDNNAFENCSIKSFPCLPHLKIIGNESFERCKNLKNLAFSDDSELNTIENKAFGYSAIETLTIPENLIELKSGWCENVVDLKNIILSPKNKNFCYLDKDKKIICGKSDQKKDIFDVIVFASRDVKQCIIPPTIKIIESNSFENCRKLKSIQISEDSQLTKINQSAFKDSNITEIFIPKNVESIGIAAFEGCRYLKNIYFDEYSILKSIGKTAFGKTNINSLIFPKSLTKFNLMLVGCFFLKAVEFLAEDISINFKCFSRSKVVMFSFPNVRKIEINNAAFNAYYMMKSKSIFINQNAEIILN